MTKIIDADGHIVEPHSLWREYIEPKFRARIPQVAKDAEGIDRVQVEGRLLPRVVAPTTTGWRTSASRIRIVCTMSRRCR